MEGNPGGRVDPVAGVDRDGNNSVVVHLVGELDLYNAHLVREALLACAAEEPGRLVVDLAGVDFIDSTALGTILKAAGQLEEGGHLLAVVAPDGPVRRLLEMTNLTGRFRLFPTRAQALEHRPASAPAV